MKINTEQSDLHKLKQSAKITVANELEKIKNFDEMANYEFKRINAFIRTSQAIYNLLMEH